jgi:hypothetical protein
MLELYFCCKFCCNQIIFCNENYNPYALSTGISAMWFNNLLPTMKKTALFLSGIFLISSVLFVSQPTYAMDKGDNTATVAAFKKPKNTAGTSNKTKTKTKKPKNANSKAAGGRCKNPDDRDASGKRCGNRASSVKKGGAS